MNLLESASLSFSTGGGINTGCFFGFQGNDDIGFFALSDAFIGITGLTVTGAGFAVPELEEPDPLAPQDTQAEPVPEPATFALLGAGMLGLCLLRKRRDRSGA
jgi:hypothetical protein